MVRYSKNYEGALVSSIESMLDFLFGRSVDFVIKKFDQKKVIREMKAGNDQITNQKISKLFYELKRHKYITTETSESDLAIRLTNKAKIKIIEKIVAQSGHDHKYRYVSFDIPERLHYQRDLFRRTIKRMGFQQIQQSLWVTDKNIGGLVDDAALEYKVSDYVAYIVSETSNIDQLVKDTLTIIPSPKE